MSTLVLDSRTEPVQHRRDRIEVNRWPSETPLFLACLFVSLVLWVLIAVSIVGLIYAFILGVAFFVMQVGFIAHVRGSGVRLGPDQFPELHARVEELAHRMGMEQVPEAYIMQAGGTLNALATRFLRSHIVILFSDLLEACGGNESARDMIIAHELGHIRSNHLRWRILLLPASLVPFLGTALSRAREYTCDRYGLAGAGDRDGALLGLSILAAGGKYGPHVNRQALVRQRELLNTGWMTLGEWLSTHPPLAKRLVALDPSLGDLHHSSARGVIRAFAILGLIVLPFWGLSIYSIIKFADVMKDVQSRQQAVTSEMNSFMLPDSEADAEMYEGFEQLASFLEADAAAGNIRPESATELYERWDAAYPDVSAPVDPYDGQPFGYVLEEDGYALWSSGPDGEPGTDDDVVYRRE